jgi:hypothetical protein
MTGKKYENKLQWGENGENGVSKGVCVLCAVHCDTIM